MQGRIVSVNTSAGTGVLQADTGGQWLFRAQQWRGQGVPPAGQIVSFDISGREAVNVMPVSAAWGAPWGGGSSAPWAGNVASRLQTYGDPFSRPAMARQSLLGFYFSPSGRVSLGQYWLRYLIPATVLILIAIGLVIWVIFHAYRDHVAQPLILTVVGLIVVKVTLLTWISFMMHIKRMHDLNMSWLAGTVIEDFVPLGRDWMLFRMLFQQGTVGPNNFGPDPRQ